MRPEVAATLLMWSVGLLAAVSAVVVLLIVERFRDRRLRDLLVDAAMRDGEKIAALRAEADGLRTQNMMQAAEIESLSAPSEDRQPRRPVVRQGRPDDELWRRIVDGFHHPCPPGFPPREGLDGGEVS